MAMSLGNFWKEIGTWIYDYFMSCLTVHFIIFNCICIFNWKLQARVYILIICILLFQGFLNKKKDV